MFVQSRRIEGSNLDVIYQRLQQDWGSQLSFVFPEIICILLDSKVA